MARQESVNSRIKSFVILKQSYCHKLEDHGDVFRAILVIIQIGIEFCNEPLFSCSDYIDWIDKDKNWKSFYFTFVLF